MIPRTIPAVQGLSTQESSWQEELGKLITQPDELLARLEITQVVSTEMRAAMANFPLRVTESFVARMEVGNIHDPLLLQVLPQAAEKVVPKGWTSDPLDETRFRKHKGLIHKYAGRALLIAAPHCAINCRYCFRRHFDYNENSPSRHEWLKTLDYIKQDQTIEEVILSGGDPLAINDKQLAWLIAQIETIEHVKQLRIHSRLPIVLPSRLTQNLLSTLSKTRLKSVFVVHCNHPNEINSQVQTALQQLRLHGILALNQSVLLKNVNDSSDILTILSKKLFECDVLPYYLHLLDKVKGAMHFDVPRSEATIIYNKLRANLPGYLVPQLVEEIAGAKSKTLVV